MTDPYHFSKQFCGGMYSAHVSKQYDQVMISGNMPVAPHHLLPFGMTLRKNHAVEDLDWQIAELQSRRAELIAFFANPTALCDQAPKPKEFNKPLNSPTPKPKPKPKPKPS